MKIIPLLLTQEKRDHFSCVSVAIGERGVAVRDTKDPHQNTLVFTLEEWDAFIKGVKDGEFNLPNQS